MNLKLSMLVQLVLALAGSALGGSALDASPRAPAPAVYSLESPLLNMDDVVIRDTNALTVADIDKASERLEPFLESFTKTPYFSYYKVDLSDRLCPFKDDSGICGNRACAVEPLEDETVPAQYGTGFLGKLRPDSVSTEAPEGAVQQCAPEDRSIFARPAGIGSFDYCYPEDGSGAGDGVWVDLNDNIERYTGYSGPHAHKVWRAVYQENCFGYTGDDYAADDLAEAAHWGRGAGGHGRARSGAEAAPTDAPGSAGRSPAGGPAGGAGLDGGDALLDALQRAESQLAVLFADSEDTLTRYARQELGGEAGDRALNQETHCVEQRLFYKILSGMHASISTHLSFDFLDPKTREWGPNLDEFMARVGTHPDRLNHLYFNYVLVSRALSKLRAFLGQLAFSTSCPTLDDEVRGRLVQLARLVDRTPRGLDETQIFASVHGKLLKEEFRTRVRNVNALMSCVGCERCCLWGKIQTAGYGTALKILFELPERPQDDWEATEAVLPGFRRSELVALVQTFARLTHSVRAVQQFRVLLENRLINKRSFSYQWAQAMREFRAALYFVLRSYIDFPRNVWDLTLAYATIYWNKFIGRQFTYTMIDRFAQFDL